MTYKSKSCETGTKRTNKIITKNTKTKNEVKVSLNEWQEVSILCEDNIRYQESYIPEYLGMLKTFDAVLWRTDIDQFNIANSILDAIKIKYFPKRLLKIFPAKVRNIDIRVLYPEVSKFPDKAKLTNWKKTKKFLVVTERQDIYGIDL